MNLFDKEKVLLPVGVLALACVLVVLAVLQYKWTQELNDAAGDRMRAGLQSSMIGLREDLGRELLTIALALQPESHRDGSGGDADWYVQRLEAWKKTAAHPDLVANVFLAETSAKDRIELRQLNSATHQFEKLEWPSRLLTLRDPLSAMALDLSTFEHPRRPNLFQPFLQHGGPHSPPWIIDESIPALLHPEIDPRPNAANDVNEPSSKISWIIVELNEGTIQQQVLPELAQHFFGGDSGLVYDVGVISRTRKNRLLYSSNANFGTGTNIPTDARLKLFGPIIGRPGQPRDVIFRNGPPPDERSRGERDVHFSGHPGLPRLEPLHHDAAPEGDWELIVKHRNGSLEAALASTRRGHLIISFGVLLVLAVTMTLIIVASRRAHRLASLQMEFVAGVSHELRTPLAIIASAADNIADGVVEDKAKLIRYSRVIRDQSRQLTNLVEQILLFAATRQRRYQYSARSVAPEELVETALTNSAELIRTAGFTVERHIEPNLHEVMVDVPAVSHCLQNLIANAVKYGGEGRWIGVRAYEADTEAHSREIQIAVQDKGIGIEAKEQQRIFDAFYRSPAIVGAQIHGTGLGLALAKGIAEAMGGRLSLSSEPGHGSTFVLHLPCVEESAACADEATPVVSASVRDN